jgi:NTE family protein
MPDHTTVRPRRVGLALGSGSARGWAHLGVIRALSDAGIQVSCTAGSSIGALVAATLSLGNTAAMEDFVRQLDWRQIVSFLDVTFPRSGLIDGRKITDFFRGHVREVNIQDMPVPYCAVATDLTTGREVLLDRGDLIQAIRASISVPGIFTPVRAQDRFLIDGGLVNPVPVSVARRMGTDFVIAVDLNHQVVEQRYADNGPAAASASAVSRERLANSKWAIVRELNNRLKEFNSPALAQVRQWLDRSPMPSIFDVLATSISIMETQITAARLAAEPPDLLIRPQLSSIRLLEFHRAEEAIAEGYRAAAAQIRRMDEEGWDRIGSQQSTTNR